MLGVEMSKALPFFHALTGCDTVSAFFGIGKVVAFKFWKAMGDVLTTAFLKISLENLQIIEESEHYKTITKFITMCYDCKHAQESHCSVRSYYCFAYSLVFINSRCIFIYLARRYKKVPVR